MASDTLRKMLRPAPASGSRAAMSEARTWRFSVPRSSEEAAGLVASVAGLDDALSDLDGVLGAWDDFAIALSMTGPDGARGLAFADLSLRAALIEAQTIGRVMRGTIPERRATRWTPR